MSSDSEEVSHVHSTTSKLSNDIRSFGQHNSNFEVNCWQSNQVSLLSRSVQTHSAMIAAVRPTYKTQRIIHNQIKPDRAPASKGTLKDVDPL